VKKNSIFLVLCFVCSVFFLVQVTFSKEKQNDLGSEFVVKKQKTQKKSKSKLQEQGCQVFASQMSWGPQVHKHIADMQQVLLEQTVKYIENSKDGILLKNKKDKIDNMTKVAQEFESKMEQFCKECEQYVSFLNSQK